MAVDIDDQLELIYQMIDRAVKAALAEAAPRWIPVGERLPPGRGWVLTLDHKTGAIERSFYAQINMPGSEDHGRWIFNSMAWATHWQPLLPPPAD